MCVCVQQRVRWAGDKPTASCCGSPPPRPQLPEIPERCLSNLRDVRGQFELGGVFCVVVVKKKSNSDPSFFWRVGGVVVVVEVVGGGVEGLLGEITK